MEATITHSLSIPDALPGQRVAFSFQRVTAVGGGTPTIEVIGAPLIQGYFWS